MSSNRKIITEYDPKPIGSRNFDWSAVEDGYEPGDATDDGYLPGDPVGYGATEQDAIDDLKEQIAALRPDGEC